MVYCEHCGTKHQKTDNFCSKCGFNLRDSVVVPAKADLMPVQPKQKVEYQPPELTSQPRFISPQESRSLSRVTRSVSRSSRSSRSGWILGFAFLGIAFVFSFILLWAVIGIDMSCPFSDFGRDMGNLGATLGTTFGGLGERLGDLGGRLGEIFGNFGNEIGNTFDGFGDRISDSFDHSVSFSLPLTILSIFGRLFFVGFLVFVIIFFVSRSRQRHQRSE
jgi:hypothetical protein